jgi:hypothetical protein
MQLRGGKFNVLAESFGIANIDPSAREVPNMKTLSG